MATNLLGFAILGAILYQLIWKRQMPEFLHPLYKHQAQFYDKQKNKELTDGLRALNLIVGFICIWAAYIALGSIMMFWPVFLGVGGVVAFFFADISRKTYSHYAKVEPAARQKTQLKEAYGARSLATLSDLTNSTDEYGFYIGAPYWHWFGDGHFLTIGETGDGKNAAIIIPNLISKKFLSTSTSVFCLDPKGENYFICADMMEHAGYNVYRLNPADIFGMGSDHFNLFDMIEYDSPDIVSFCQTIAEALCPIVGRNATEDHFADKAQGLLLAYMLYMIHKQDGKASFITLYDMITLPIRDRMKLLESEMMQTTCYNGIVAKEANGIAGGFEGGGEKEMSSVYSDATKVLKAFRDLQLQNIVQNSDFSFTDLIDKPTAVFVNIPFGQLENSAGWIRAMIAILSREMERKTQRDRRLLIILDEFVQIGTSKEVERGFVTLRSFGVSYHLVIQNFQQLKTNYPGSYKSFFSSSAVTHALKVKDPDMAKILSDMTGKDVNALKMEENHAPHIVQKPVVRIDEFQSNDDSHYLFLKGMPNVIKLPKVFYFNNPNFTGQYRSNPLHDKSYQP